MKFINHTLRCWLSAILLIISSMLTTAAASQSDKLQDLEQLQAQITTIAKKYKLPSVSYSLVQQGETLAQESFGLADIDQQIAATVGTPYRIASVSKMVVGIAIMQLLESRQLSMDTHLKDLLPKLEFENPWENSHPVLLKHLLENTTGWDDIALKEFAYNNEPQLSLQQALAINPNSRTSRWVPGSRHAYTNSTATVAALIVEQSTGIPFSQYAQQFIFSPLGITSADYGNHPEGTGNGYGKNNQKIHYKPVLMTPSGALTMSLQDMNKLLMAMVVRDSRLLSKDSYERIEVSQSSNAGNFDAGYGIFNYARYYHGNRFRGHDGALPGWLTELSYSPEHKVGFVVMQNSANGRAFREIVTAISNYLINSFPEAETHQVQDIESPEQWTGYYRVQNPRSEKRYFLERLISSNKLTKVEDEYRFTGLFPPGWSRTLSYIGEGRWQNPQGEVVMVKATDPLLGEVVHYGDRVFIKESAFSAWFDKLVLLLWFVTLLLAIPTMFIWWRRIAKKRYSVDEDYRLRLVLLTSALSGLLFLILLIIGMMSPIARLGGPGVISLGLMLASLAIPACTLWAAYQYTNTFKQVSGKFVKVFGGLLLSTKLLVALYLGWFGVFGIVTWS